MSLVLALFLILEERAALATGYPIATKVITGYLQLKGIELAAYCVKGLDHLSVE